MRTKAIIYALATMAIMAVVLAGTVTIVMLAHRYLPWLLPSVGVAALIVCGYYSYVSAVREFNAESDKQTNG